MQSPIDEQVLVEKYGFGSLVKEEAICLAKYALIATPPFAEIGTWAGRTSRLLARSLIDTERDGHVVTIDVSHAKVHWEAISDIVISGRLVLELNNAPEYFSKHPGPYGLILIDGCHCQECVEKDIIASVNIVSDGGYLMFHDAIRTNKKQRRKHSHSGRKYGVVDAIKRSNLKKYRRIEQVNSLCVFQKVSK